MNIEEFIELPDSARLWIIPTVRELTLLEQEALTNSLEKFLTQWTAHKQSVKANVKVLYARFILIVADETNVAVSGCAIDSMVSAVTAALAQIDLTAAPLDVIFYRNTNGVAAASRLEFKSEVKNKKVNAKTVVFDNTVSCLKSLRNGLWELPFDASWHAKAFHSQPKGLK